jgi:hypothetical protein
MNVVHREKIFPECDNWYKKELKKKILFIIEACYDLHLLRILPFQVIALWEVGGICLDSLQCSYAV